LGVFVKRPEGFPVLQAADLPVGEKQEEWLIRPIWSRSGVGFLFGIPKSSKSWFALDMAVSVTSGTPCLGRFAVEDPGPALIFLAEDPQKQTRRRLASLCEHRGIALDKLPLQVLDVPAIRLDISEQLDRLRSTLEALRPRLLLLDPFIRIHRRSENDAQEISGLLGDLRELQRQFDMAIVIVHHARKRSSQNPGESLRGSSDLYAWVDTAAHIAKLNDGRRRVSIEHRMAPSPEPFLFELASRDDGTATHLRVLGESNGPSILFPTASYPCSKVAKHQ